MGATFLLSLLLPGMVRGQGDPLVDLERVRFETMGDGWLRTDITIRANRNPAAVNPRYVSRIEVELILSFQRRSGAYDFYRSRAELVALEQNESAVLSFYLPGVILERDRLHEPFAYLVQVIAGGHSQPFTPASASRNIRDNPAALKSLQNRADMEGSENDGILLPEYLVPGRVVNSRQRKPYRRLEPERP